MTSAIIVAAGSSRRMGFNKLLAPLAGTPVLRRTLDAFESCDAITEIIVVASDEVKAAVESWKHGMMKLAHIVAGGVERHHSVCNGIQHCAPQSEIIAVHDGGRPLITTAQITRCINAAKEHGAATCARPVTETMKRADATGRVTDSIDRTGAWIMETPQVFLRDILIRAYQHVMRENILVTDEVSAAQAIAQPVFVVENTTPNPKITFPADLALAEKLLPE